MQSMDNPAALSPSQTDQHQLDQNAPPMETLILSADPFDQYNTHRFPPQTGIIKKDEHIYALKGKRLDAPPVLQTEQRKIATISNYEALGARPRENAEENRYEQVQGELP